MLRPDEVNELNIIPRLASRAQIQWRIAQYCNSPSFETPISLPLQSNTSHLAQQPPMASTISTNTMSSTEASATPSLAEPSTATPTIATAESNQTSLNSSDGEEDGRSRSNSRTLRPRLGTRKSSGTMIVPADHPDVEIKEESYPADDARAMSPRRSSADTERMVQEARQVAETHAIEKQSGINALIERIESVKAEHDKLERNNNALQDYIGGLHRSMSRTALDTSRKK